MNTAWLAVLVFICGGLGLWLSSLILEALRRAPETPKQLSWALDIAIDYVTVNGHRLRYIRTGRGPTVVLLHTLRTQLDLFEKIVPDLARDFTVYALDYPGHGFSDIPKAKYDADFFVRSVEGFLDALDLRNVRLCGVSIGGAICLILAGRRHARISGVIPINPYDYARGRGMARSSLLGWMIVMSSRIPVVGETIMRLRSFVIMKAVLRGGVANSESIPRELLKEMYEVGNRPRHYRAFISLLRNASSWEEATKEYGNASVPIRLVWGEKDWAHTNERKHDSQLIPRAETATIDSGGHFLPLDQPNALV